MIQTNTTGPYRHAGIPVFCFRYWLTPPLSKMKQFGLLSENALWSARSNLLYLFCWKNKMEALRKLEKVSGNEWWLLQDFWTGANGILDT